MPKIEILEKDLTTPGVVSDSTDVVYVPGFVDTTQSSLSNSSGEFIGLRKNEPRLFTSVTEFISLCGKKPATFPEDQEYPVGTTESLFTEGSYDVSDVMFVKGQPDPGYIMAKELLASGISVVFERINSDPEVKVRYVPKTDALSKDNPSYLYTLSSGEEIYVKYTGQEMSGKPVNGKVKKINKVSVTKFAEGTTYYTMVGDTEGALDMVDKQLGEFLVAPKYESGKQYYTFSDVTDPSELEIWDSDTCVNFVAVVDDSEGAGYRFIRYNMPGIIPSNAYVEEQYDETISVESMYEGLSAVFDTSNIEGIVDKGNYSVKYITSGGYPTYEYDGGSLVVKMLNFAETRGDCVALIDHTDYLDRELNPTKDGSLFKSVNDSRGLFADSGEYGAMFTPWSTYNRITSDYEVETYKKYEGTSMEKEESRDVALASTTQLRAPGSFAYLMSLADSIKTNANWMAVAGVTRGKVRNLASDGMTTVIPNGVADAMQPRKNAVTINAITNISPYGYTIWGNRTLKPVEENLVATNFLNIRNLISDIKKTCYRVARKTTFEQNTDILWINFSSEIGKLLDRMKTGFGISGYKIVKDTEHEKAAERATLCAKIIIYPTYAVEDFYITVVLKDDEVVVQ
jgi:hypothetical protein